MTDAGIPLIEAFKGPRWRRALTKALADLGSKQRIAYRLGLSRTYVSRVMSGDIDPVPQSFIDRVIDRLDVVECPHTFQQQARGECRFANSPAPTHNPFRLAHWQACQSCPQKPEIKKET